MTNNLTYPVLLNDTLNESLVGSSKIWWNDPPIAALIGVIGIVIGAIAAGSFQFIIEWYRIKESKRSDRILAYGNLLGCKHLILQYYESYLVAMINAESSILHSRYNATKRIDFAVVEKHLKDKETEAANQYASQTLASVLEKSIDLREGLRFRQRVDDLAIQLGNTNEKFWGTIGQVKTLFHDINVTDLVKEIETAENELDNSGRIINNNFNNININTIIELKLVTSNEKRDLWYNEKEEALRLQVDYSLSDVRTKIVNLDSKIDNLLDYLEDYLRKNSWWQFWR